MSNNVRVTVIQRADVVSALLGERPASDRVLDLEEVSDISPNEFGLIYEGLGAGRPTALVLHEDGVHDFFVWLETYAPQFFPLTQYCRVVTPELAQLYGQDHVVARSDCTARTLAGVIVGEVIAQTAHNPVKALEGAVLAHAFATASFSLAKAELLRESGFDFRTRVSSGLAGLVENGLVSERRLAPADVIRFWNVAFGGVGTEGAGDELSGTLRQAVRDIAEGGLSTSSVSRLARSYEPACELKNLHSASAEDRVLKLDRLLEASALSPAAGSRAVEDFCLAYAAIEVGGGSTRHIGLLQEYGERRPIVWLWFGLLASIGSGDKWHPAFARFGRVVHKELQFTFQCWDPPRVDIALEELRAHGLSRTASAWPEIPRAHLRYLSVELAPGVPFQLHVAAGNDRSTPTPSARPSLDVDRLDRALAELWAIRQAAVSDQGRESPKPKSSRRSSRSGKAKKGELL